MKLTSFIDWLLITLMLILAISEAVSAIVFNANYHFVFAVMSAMLAYGLYRERG